MTYPARWIRLAPFFFVLAAFSQTQPPTFKADANLQSIAVQVTDRQGRDVTGLTAADFTILEDGHPQKVAFFGAENQPISFAVLLDSSSSMESSKKLDGARTLLRPLLHGNLPEDEIFFLPFTDSVGPFQSLSAEQRVSPPAIRLAQLGGGTALYDALATAPCHMRSVNNVRQAVVVITDGADQHSRLEMEQLISLAQSAKPQIFMVGFFDGREHDIYKQSGKTVTLITGHDIDNPLQVFTQISKETGAESFFPSNEKELQQVVSHILGVLQAQYTVAYYPQDIAKYRRIEVKVNRSGVKVASRHSVGSEEIGGGVHFLATSCEVSPIEHPYPWEPHVTKTASHRMLYQDDFSDPQSGWPRHPDSHYGSGFYEIANLPKPQKFGTVTVGQNGLAFGILAAYGPWWHNFQAAISVAGTGAPARGMIFRLNDEGCYVLLLSLVGKNHELFFKLVKRTFTDMRETPLLPWTAAPATATNPNKTAWRLTVECVGDEIKVLVNQLQVTTFKDKSFRDGYVGVTQFGNGRTLFRDLRVEGLPD